MESVMSGWMPVSLQPDGMSKIRFCNDGLVSF